MVVIAVLCIHAVLVYAFVTGLAQRFANIVTLPFQSVLTFEPQAREQPPPLPKPRFVPAEPEAPVPNFTVDAPESPAAIHVTAPPRQTQLPAVPTTPSVVTRVLGGPGAGFPNTDDFYPPMARRLGEAGSTTVQVCIDANGRLTASPLVVRSSGIASLDAGSLNVAKAGSGHYRPTTENGRPVSSCYAFRVTFRLRD